MAKIPDKIHSLPALIDEAMEREEASKPSRGHMGISGLGMPCDRRLWLQFRWALTEHKEGRLLRLFARGHREEEMFVSLLRRVGVEMRDVLEKQRHVNLGKHVAGSMDGIALSGIPEAPGTSHLLEFKTANRNSFNAIAKNGVMQEKWEHYVQMQCYMHATGLERAAYLVVCKDDDRLHYERIKYDKAVAEKAIERGQRIAMAERIPEPISRDPSWWQCKLCPFSDFCHPVNDDLPNPDLRVNLRTNANATPMEDGTWHDERWQYTVPEQHQDTDSGGTHILHPDLLPESWRMVEPLDQWTAVWDTPFGRIANGEKRDGVFTSQEILANPEACAKAGDTLNSLRSAFGATVEG